MYVKAGNYAAAEEQLRFAVKGLPQDAEAHFALGSVADGGEAVSGGPVRNLLLAAKLKPDLAGIYGNLAVVAAAEQELRPGDSGAGCAREVLAGNSSNLLPAGDIL